MGLLHPADIDVSTKQRIAEGFSRGACAYDEVAHIQHQIAQYALSYCSTAPAALALDIGCGSGRHTKAAGQGATQIIGLDLAKGMIEQAKQQEPEMHWLVGDAEAIPLAAQSVERVFSSMALQWCANTDLTMREIARVLSANGTATLAIMLGESFAQLAAARRAVGLTSAVNAMPSLLQWQKSAVKAGLQVRLGEVKQFTDYHPDLRCLLHSIKRIGAGTLLQTPVSKRLTRLELTAMQTFYQQNFATENGLPLDYRVGLLQLVKE